MPAKTRLRRVAIFVLLIAIHFYGAPGQVSAQSRRAEDSGVGQSPEHAKEWPKLASVSDTDAAKQRSFVTAVGPTLVQPKRRRAWSSEVALGQFTRC